MAKQHDDSYREKFRPNADSALDREIEAALSGMSVEDLYDKADATDKPAPAEASNRAMRKGRVVSIGKDDVFVDLGGKSQGIASLVQFEELPKVGDEIEFAVDRYDPREGLVILKLKGAKASNVSWETLELGQIVE